MLLIEKEFRKGILFVRLKGRLTREEVPYLNMEVTRLIEDIGIHNVVFNISNINDIDMEGVNVLLYNYNLCRNNDGISMLCGVNSEISEYINHSSISNMFQIKDEISAMNMIEI